MKMRGPVPAKWQATGGMQTQPSPAPDLTTTLNRQFFYAISGTGTWARGLPNRYFMGSCNGIDSMETATGNTFTRPLSYRNLRI